MTADPSQPPAITDHPEGAEIPIRVIPRAGRTLIAGVRGGAVLVRLAAAPVGGTANAALIRLLAEVLHVPARTISLVAGEHARDKRVRVAGCRAAEVRRRLSAILCPGP